ncbi:MAG TPA: mannonate dehydratase [Bryobacteraceae bacterium]|nr:mannonate dehydratase [Bryobacteraceae bacterium]
MKLRGSNKSGGSAGSGRRDLLKLPLAAAAAQAVSTAPFVARAAARMDEYDPNNTKIATLVNAGANDDQFLFLKQIGVRWVHVQFPLDADFDLIKNTQDRLARYGIGIHQGIVDHYRSTRIQLGQPGRDADIEKFQTFIRSLGRLGIYCTKIDFHPGNTYTTRQITTERGYKVREYDVNDFHKEVEKQMYDRVYTADDIWANYTYFIKAVLPVAEKADVRLALHPDDPPTAASAMMNGVAKIFVDYEGYKRADEVAGHSPYWGLTFCVGTWSEGGARMGKDVFGMIDDFGARGKIFAVHFRNVSSPLPRFHETFQDDGYMDMYQVMRALRKVKCTASLIPDHYPSVVNDPGHRIADTYSITYMRALLRRANEEVG